MGELFEYFLIVTLQDKVPAITFRFPEKITEKVVTDAIPRFCFPDVTEILDQTKTLDKDKPRIVESFSFTSTVSDGGKRWGYCRRFLYADKNKSPTCFCLLSFCSSFSLFSQILDVVELKMDEGDKAVYNFLHSVLAQPFPGPGETVVAQTISFAKNDKGESDYKPEIFRLTRTDNDYEYLEYTTFEPLFKLLDINTILYIFECLLQERRIVVVAQSLGTLSACVDAISNMAYPFAWQYVFIPILPKSMLSFLGAPMPFLMGILSSVLPDIDKEPIEEEALIVDLDHNRVLRKPEDIDFMPLSLLTSLERSLKKIQKTGKSGMEFNLLIATSFLKFFMSMFGDYAKFIDAQFKFDFDKFLKHKPTEVKKFIQQFREVQMCSYFFQERETMAAQGTLNWCILQRVTRSDLKKKLADTLDHDRLKPRQYVREILQSIRDHRESTSAGSRDTVTLTRAQVADAPDEEAEETTVAASATVNLGTDASNGGIGGMSAKKTVLSVVKVIKQKLNMPTKKSATIDSIETSSGSSTKDSTKDNGSDAVPRANTQPVPRRDKEKDKDKEKEKDKDAHKDGRKEAREPKDGTASDSDSAVSVKAMAAAAENRSRAATSAPPRPPRDSNATSERTKELFRLPSDPGAKKSKVEILTNPPKVPPKPNGPPATSAAKKWPPPPSRAQLMGQVNEYKEKRRMARDDTDALPYLGKKRSDSDTGAEQAPKPKEI